jgi:hypothetical protein
MKVFIYFNLHKRVFSVKAMEGENKGRVIAHREQALVNNPQFRVSQAGRARVLREKKKNVHAGVYGTWVDVVDDGLARTALSIAADGQPVRYNPYKYDSFVDDNEQRVFEARVAALSLRTNDAGLRVGSISMI